MERRDLLKAGLLSAGMLALPFTTRAGDAKLALTQSNLVYLSPIRANGQLSSCQAEVWYVMLGPDVYVCTASRSWRARAPKVGARLTRLWVGDLGVWRRADYQSLPAINAVASIEQDDARIEAALEQFGRKYPAEWGTWGPRFRNGLADGSRTLLRYELTS